MNAWSNEVEHLTFVKLGDTWVKVDSVQAVLEDHSGRGPHTFIHLAGGQTIGVAVPMADVMEKMDTAVKL